MMDGEDFQPYAIRRIRLVNFHNFQDETIELRDGGHFFLLGENGSGKTTILDAVQYVLTAGNSLELNAAARLGGARQEGRRVQGIVMRYNVDTGPLNKEGGVSYAALELEGRNGQPLTLGVGLSAYSMDEKIQRWGVIKEVSLEGIPFTVEEGDGKRVLGQRELKERLDGASGFYGIGPYEKELARRLFGTEAIFEEVCRFLSMGKAYREIASQAADYHDLFKKLLPEPKTDLFERIVESLKSLEDSAGTLEDMERKHAYLESLRLLVESIEECRDGADRYRWLLAHWALREAAAEGEALARSLEACATESGRLAEEARVRERQVYDLDDRLADLKARDSSGSVRLEKELTGAYTRLDGARAGQERTCLALEERASAALRAEAGAGEAFRAAANSLRAALDEGATALGLDGSTLAGSLNDLAESPSPALGAEALPWDEFSVRLEGLLQERRKAATLLEERTTRLREEEARLSREIAALRKERELHPGREGFAEALSRLAALGIKAVTLYSELEWSGRVDAEKAAAAEEIIGEDILFTLQVRGEDYPAAREAVLPDFPGVRLACRKRGEGKLTPWVEAHFDSGESEPSALLCLSEEMEASRGPVLASLRERPVTAFRSHETGLAARPSRWIGGERRRRAWKERIEALEAELRAIGASLTTAAAEADSLQASILSAESLKTRLAGEYRRLLRLENEWSGAAAEAARLREGAQGARKLLEETSREAAALRSRLEDLRGLIRREGLDELEARIAALEKERREADTRLAETREGQGGLKERISGLRARDSERQAREREAEEEMQVHARALRARNPGLGDVEHHVLRVQKGFQFKSAGHVRDALAEADRKESQNRGALQEKLGAPLHGSLFGLSYEAAGNALVDRRGRPVAELVAEQRRSIDEQKLVINEKTADLFKRIIGSELAAYFNRYVTRLEQMVRQINKLLSDRDFGGTRYGLELHREERYKTILEAVRKFNPLDGGSREELRHFIEDNREGILNAEVGTIPEPLDYRNWFRYHLRFTALSGQGVLMDRKTKSLGSGGEQAVPNYLLVLSIARFLFHGNRAKVHALLFDEAFYGIDAGRRDQLLGFAGDLGIQLLVASPDQDGVKREIKYSTTLLVVKDKGYDVHLYPFQWENDPEKQMDLLEPAKPESEAQVRFGAELGS